MTTPGDSHESPPGDSGEAGAFPHVPLPPHPPRSNEETARLAREFYEWIRTRRTVRRFAPDPVPRAVVEDVIRAAATAPSGAHRQPWRFVAVGDPALKARIREAAEREERESYAAE